MDRSVSESKSTGSRRVRVSAERIFELARHLTERDKQLCLFLYRHRVLTTDQLELLFFSSRRRAQDRLLFLYRNRLVDRFYPPHPFGMGKPQAHWLLDEGGALLVAAARGVERRRLGWERRDDWGAHPQLARQLEANRFVTDLIAATLPDPALGVTAWWSPRDAAARLCSEQRHRRALPDGGFFLDAPAGAIECYLEWDRATETQATLGEKIERYWASERRWQERRERLSVLFGVPSVGRCRTLYRAYAHAAAREREREGRSPLARARWPIVCATVPDLRRNGPLGAVWHDLGVPKHERPRALTELPARGDMPAPKLERALGRRWRKERPDFWAALSPLGASASLDGCVPGLPQCAAPESRAARTSGPSRLESQREEQLAQARRDIEAARTGGRLGSGDLRTFPIDGLIDGDPEEEEDW